MNAKRFFDTVAGHQEKGASEIMMRLNCGQPFGARYHGQRIDCVVLLCVLKDLMNDNDDGNICISFENAADGTIRDINIEVCADSHNYGMCVDGVDFIGGGILISVRETSVG